MLKNEQNFKISQFLTYINILYIKRKHFSCRIQILPWKIFFVSKKFKKIGFFRFFIKNYADQLDSTTFFSKLAKKISKMTFSGLIRRLELKSHQIWARYLERAWNGGRQTTLGGVRHPSPVFLGLKQPLLSNFASNLS